MSPERWPLGLDGSIDGRPRLRRAKLRCVVGSARSDEARTFNLNYLEIVIL